MGRPPKADKLLERHKFLARNWDVLEDSLLCGMTVLSIARKRGKRADKVRAIIRESWALDITVADLRKYLGRE